MTGLYILRRSPGGESIDGLTEPMSHADCQDAMRRLGGGFRLDPANADAVAEVKARGEAYAAACDRAATEQGLDPFVAACERLGLDVGVWQTGGFCMVAAVTSPRGEVVFTEDAGLAHYTPEQWENGDGVEIVTGSTDPEVCADAARRYIAGDAIAFLVRRGYGESEVVLGAYRTEDEACAARDLAAAEHGGYPNVAALLGGAA